MAQVRVGDLTMYYEEHGRPDGPPLVLTHTFMGTSGQWRHQLRPFGERYRVLALDMRGHGRTDNPGGLGAMHHRQLARDVAGFCDALGLDRPILCGWSSGAMLLLSLSVERPDLARTLILTAATYFYDRSVRDWWLTQTPESVMPSPEHRARHTAHGPESWREVASAFINLNRHEHAEDFPSEDELRTIRTPALIVHGDRDEFFPVRIPAGLYGLLPDAELCILPNTGHYPPSERPALYNAVVLDYLGRQAGGSCHQTSV